MSSLVEREVLANIKPEPLPKHIKETILRLQETFPDTEVLLGGSTARNTHLKGDYDVDVFIRFAETEGMEKMLEKGLKQLFSAVEIVHGSREYFQVHDGKWTFEFIPVKHITDWHDAENVTDVSPLHVEYAQEHLTDELADHVRLLKQFCKSAGVYGAESYIGGFSGHVLELLTVHYGSFQETVQAIAGWKEREALDPAKHETKLDESKTPGPLTIIDPVQPERNAAAAVTAARYTKLQDHALAYHDAKEDHQEDFFTVTPLTEESFKEQHTDSEIITLHIKPQEGKHDIVAAKALKALQYVTRQLHQHGFTVTGHAWEFDEQQTLALYAVPRNPLEEDEVLKGPPVEREVDSNRFKEKHAGAYEEGGNWYAKRKRKYREPVQLIEDLAHDKYITSRVQQLAVKR